MTHLNPQAARTTAEPFERHDIDHRLPRAATAVTAVIGAGWLVVSALILRHRIFVSSDTVSNYAHVWYVSRVVVHLHRIPYHMAIIGHGRGLAFPYAFVPWVTAALLRPMLGDWIVTLWLVVGSIGMIATTLWAFPELRRGWWPALVLADPFVVMALVLGQLPFVWAMAFFFAGIACWRTNRPVAAAVLAGIGQATHAAVVLPIAALLVVGWLYWEPRRRALLVAWLASLVIASPAAWIVFQTPAYTDSSLGLKIASFTDTVGTRLLVVAVPIALVIFRRFARTWMLPIALVLFVAGNVALLAESEMRLSWRDLAATPDRSLVAFLDSRAFSPGLEYRVLISNDRRIGMYEIIQRDGRLDSEFFPESIDRRTWPDPRTYCTFLRERAVDRVVIPNSYDRDSNKNEQAMLQAIGAGGRSRCPGTGVSADVLARERGFTVYAITRS